MGTFTPTHSLTPSHNGGVKYRDIVSPRKGRGRGEACCAVCPGDQEPGDMLRETLLLGDSIHAKSIHAQCTTFYPEQVQRSAKKYANLAKQDPGRARQ